LNSLLQQILSNIKCVKSVQRGTGRLYVKFKSDNVKNYHPELKVPLNTIDPNKCVVILNGACSTYFANDIPAYSSGNAERINPPHLFSLNSNELIIKDSFQVNLTSYSTSDPKDEEGYFTYTGAAIISWQVIEFY